VRFLHALVGPANVNPTKCSRLPKFYAAVPRQAEFHRVAVPAKGSLSG